jgi:hypothetical protein
MLIDEYTYPTRPSPNSRFDIPHVFGLNRNLSVDTHGKDLTIKVNFGSIQAGATAWSDEFYVGARKPLDFDLSGYLYSWAKSELQQDLKQHNTSKVDI